MIAYDRAGVMVRTAVGSDIRRMKDKLRESDVREIWASHNHRPEQALLVSYSLSPYCMTITNKGTPVAMFGFAPDPEQANMTYTTATVWLLGTDGINSMWLQFLRISAIFIPAMLSICPVLYNWVDVRNVTSIRWLQWAGANFETPEPYGLEGRLFTKFTIIRSEVLSYV